MSLYYIASLKHTNSGHEHIVWWGRFHCGYTPVLGEYAGTYCYGEASELNDGVSCIAVPVEAVQALMNPEPYYKPGKRLYDQRGPVVDNTRGNWLALLVERLKPDQPDRQAPRPQTFRGRRATIDGLSDPAVADDQPLQDNPARERQRA